MSISVNIQYLSRHARSVCQSTYCMLINILYVNWNTACRLAVVPNCIICYSALLRSLNWIEFSKSIFRKKFQSITWWRQRVRWPWSEKEEEKEEKRQGLLKQDKTNKITCAPSKDSDQPRCWFLSCRGSIIFSSCSESRKLSLLYSYKIFEPCHEKTCVQGFPTR